MSNETKQPAALVIGAGIAGIQAALDIADAGFKVYLVEREPSIGGHMAQLDKTFPTLDCSACILTPKMVDVGRHPRIHLLSYSQVIDVRGQAGHFRARVKRKARYVDEATCTGCADCTIACIWKDRVPSEFEEGMGLRSAAYIPFPQAVPMVAVIDPKSCLYLTRGKCSQKCVEACAPRAIDLEQTDTYLDLDVGAVVVATGFDPFDARQKPEFGYGRYPNVISGLEFERLASASGPTAGKIKLNSKEPKEIVFVHCVGSRDKLVGKEYCSRICCMYTAKQAHLAHDKVPGANITVFYMDVRAFGKGFEEFYDRVRAEGVTYRRGNPSEIYKRGDKLIVRAEDTLLGKTVEVPADLVVLATGVQPRADAEQVAEMLGLEFSEDGFFAELHPELRPVDTKQRGVFLAGTCQAPKDIPDTVAQAKAAAAGTIVELSRLRRTLGTHNTELVQETGTDRQAFTGRFAEGS
jgi:heterodisulfide reductase subunit A